MPTTKMRRKNGWSTFMCMYHAATRKNLSAAMRNSATPGQSARRGQLQARRDRLFGELAALETQRRKGTIESPTYASRRADLVTSLEALYADLE